MPYDGPLCHDDAAAISRRPGLLARWSSWRRQTRDMRQLATWSDRELHDIALTRGDVWRSLHQPLTAPASDPRWP